MDFCISAGVYDLRAAYKPLLSAIGLSLLIDNGVFVSMFIFYCPALRFSHGFEKLNQMDLLGYICIFYVYTRHVLNRMQCLSMPHFCCGEYFCTSRISIIFTPSGLISVLIHHVKKPLQFRLQRKCRKENATNPMLCKHFKILLLYKTVKSNSSSVKVYCKTEESQKRK